MVYLVCTNPDCKAVGSRIRSPSALHPIYRRLHQDYECQFCGATLQRCGFRDYHRYVMAGAKIGA